MNGGSTKVDFKSLRRNQTEMFEILEEILQVTVLEGFPDDNFFQQFVEYRNVALEIRIVFMYQTELCLLYQKLVMELLH